VSGNPTLRRSVWDFFEEDSGDSPETFLYRVRTGRGHWVEWATVQRLAAGLFSFLGNSFCYSRFRTVKIRKDSHAPDHRRKMILVHFVDHLELSVFD
jgi:hypothetical protein